MELKKLFPDTTVARYNLSAWQRLDQDHVVLIGREVEKAGEKGKPDIGKLVLVELDTENNVVHERVIWEPIYKSFYLEDPRALLLPDNSILIGLTAVMKTEKKYEPFPALVRINSYDEWDEELPPVTLIQTFGPGKNLTPIDNTTFLFRPDSPDYYHKLLVFTLRKLVPRQLQDIEFPKNIPWGKWRIGTTMSPIWVNKNEALLIIHGINYVNKKYVYSLGRAKLCRKDDEFKVFVDEDPIITPDVFKDEKGHPLVEELHPRLRSVIYSVGGIIKRNKQDTLYLYVNVGDRATYEVGFALSDLTKGLFNESCF